MVRRLTWWVLGVGFILSSCTVQKRSIMPGWHIDFVGAKSEGNLFGSPADEALCTSSCKGHMAVNVPFEAEPCGEGLGPSEQMNPVSRLMVRPLKRETASKRAPIYAANTEWVKASAVPTNIGMVRFLLFLVGLPLIAFGLLFIALAGWEIGFLFLGPLLMIAGIAALKKAFTPNSKWGETKENPQDEIVAQLRQARKNQQRRRIEERQDRRAEARERRRLQRHAFFQSAYIRMAIGFFGILALYALLF